jgi:hypothetical protein
MTSAPSLNQAVTLAFIQRKQQSISSLGASVRAVMQALGCSTTRPVLDTGQYDSVFLEMELVHLIGTTHKGFLVPYVAAEGKLIRRQRLDFSAKF